MNMNTNTDKQGWSVKVTRLGDGRYGIRVYHHDKIHSQTTADCRADVGATVAEALRWVDKCGFVSEMASASRDRQFRKAARS